MATNDDPDFEPAHAVSPTDHVLSELQLYGHRPFQDEPDPRPLPEASTIAGAVVDIFDALVSTLTDTRLEPDLEDLLWSTVNLFHRSVERIERELDDDERAQQRSQREQNGSEVRSVELERLIAQGLTLIERRNAMELFRDQAADRFEAHTGSAWRPRTGSMVNHRALTAAMIDSREFLAARRRAETELLLPAGPKIAFTGGADFNDHRLIWSTLDKVRAKHPDMVLIHGGSPTGTERIAARWADTRKVTHISFKPDWTRHAKAAPFKRNDQILEVLPIGVVVCPGSGIQESLADKARKLGIPVWRLGTGGARAPPFCQVLIRLSFERAVVVVEGAGARPVSRRSTMAIGIVLGVFGLGFFCWLLFTLAVYALPFLAGLSAGLAAFHSGAGLIAALVVGFLVGVTILVLGQIVLATVRTPLIRLFIGLIYAVPAAVAGYQLCFALAGIGMPAGGWQHAFAAAGAIVVGATAFARMALVIPPSAGRDSVEGTVQSAVNLRPHDQIRV